MPAKGVERWLTQRLSHRLGAGPRGGDGVCAGVRFLSPRSLVGDAARHASDDDPWDPDRLVWPLLEVIDDSPRRAVVRDAGRAPRPRRSPATRASCAASRRYAVARRLAGLFRRTPRQRPQLVADWREGRDTDGAGARSPTTSRGRPSCGGGCWRGVGEPPPDVRHAADAGRAARPAATGCDLPARLSLFGHTRLPGDRARAARRARRAPRRPPLAAAGLGRAVGPAGRAERRGSGAARRRPLRDVCSGTRCWPRSAATPASCSARWRSCAGGRRRARAGRRCRPGDDLLGLLQADLRADHAPTPSSLGPRPLAEDDRSRAGARLPRPGPPGRGAARGAGRPARGRPDPRAARHPGDVPRRRDLRPADLGRRSGWPTWSARRAGGTPAHRLRVRLADRALSSTNPLLAVAAALLDLAGGRVTASQVLDLVGADAGAAGGSGFDDDDLDAGRAAGSAESGVRWGLDARHRAPLRARRRSRRTPGGPGSTGCCSASRWPRTSTPGSGAALPLDDVGSSDVDLAGRLAELRRPARAPSSTALAGAATVGRLGAARSRDGVRGADRGRRRADAWQLAAGSSASWPDAARRAAAGRRRAAAGRRPRAARRRGSAGRPDPGQLPHRQPDRLHDGADALGAAPGGVPARPRRRRLPRAPRAIDGDDVLARDPLIGERDARGEDRQLLLDAVLPADRDGWWSPTPAPTSSPAQAARPPCRSASCSTPSTRRRRATVRDGVLTRHPLQPFDAAQLRAGRWPATAVQLRPRGAGRCARGRGGPRAAPPRRCSPDRCRRAEPGDVGPGRPASRSSAHPVRGVPAAAARRRAAREDDEVARRRCRSSSTRWSSGPSATGCSPTCCAAPTPATRAGRAAARRPAAAAPRRAGSDRGRRRRSGRSSRQRRPLRAGEPRAVDVDVDLGGGRRLTGTVERRARRPRSCASPTPALGAKHRLRGLVDLLALSAGRPDGQLGRRHRRPGTAAGRARDAGRARSTTAPAAAAPTWSTSTTGPARAAAAPGEDRRSPTPSEPAATRRRGRARRGGRRGEGDRPAQRPRDRAARTPTRARPGLRRRRAARGPARRRARRRRSRGRLWDAAAWRAGGRERGAPLLAAARPGPPSTSAVRCPPARPCSRPAPARARPGPSARWSPATSPRASHPRRDAGGHLRPGRQPGAARAGARPAGRGRARRWRDPAAARGDDATLLAPARSTSRRASELGAAPRAAARRRWRASTRATIATTHQFCQLVLRGLGIAGDADARRRAGRGPRRPGRRGRRRPLPARVRRTRRRARRSHRAMAARSARAVVGDPQAELRAGRRGPATPGRAPASRFARGGARRGGAAQAAARHARLRRPALPARRRARATPTRPAPARGCGSAGGSCWSTSSRTPTRCSGRSSTARSAAAPRWC